jgi:hypothetical protein
MPRRRSTLARRDKRGPLIALFGLGGIAALVAFAAKARAGKSVPPSPLVAYKGEVIDTSPENVRVGTKLALEQWATSQGYVKLPETASDPELAAVLRMFILKANDARSEHAADSLFATMKGNALMGVIVYPSVGGHFYDLWALPP